MQVDGPGPSEQRGHNVATFGGREYSLDAGGFLDPPEQWDEGFAEGMAQSLGIEGGLSGRHWSVIRYLRRKVLEEKTLPYFVVACIENGLRLHEFRALFPTGYHRGACRIAGISYAATLAMNAALADEITPMMRARYPVSPVGFLERFDAWDEEFAAAVAREWKLPALTERHWRVVRYLRNHYAANHAVPVVYETCRATGLSLKEFGQLFPGGYRRGACRMAGLPLLP